MHVRAGIALDLVSIPALTINESVDDYDSVAKALGAALKPQGFIECMYVADISAILWETSRLRRCKTALVNIAVRTALKNLLLEFLRSPGELVPYQEAEALSFEWFTEPKAKLLVAEILNRFGLDETAIEAEAIRSVSVDLALIDGMLDSLEVRRDKALRSIANYRERAQRLQQVADRIIKAEPVRQIAASKKAL